MRATKYTVTFTAEVLSMASVWALVMEAAEQIRSLESFGGSIEKEDGDQIKWGTTADKVEF